MLVLSFGLGAVAVAAAVVSGLAMARGDKILTVLPLALLVGLAVGVLAFTRYRIFVLLLLAIRPSIDLVKLSGDPTGTAGGAGVSRGVDPSSMLAVLFLAAALLWLAGRVAEQRAVAPGRLGWALIAFGTTAYLSVIGSARPGASALEATRIASVVMMFIVLEQLIRDERSMGLVLGACYVGLLYPLLYTVFGIVTGNPPSETAGSFTRLTGPFNQSNTFSRYLAYMLVFAIAVYPYIERRLRVPALAVIMLSGVFLVMTLTRTGMLGAVIGIALVAALQRRHKILVGMSVFAVIALLMLPGVSERFGTTGTGTELGASAPTGNTVDWRFRYWAEVLPLANENPVTGIGLTMTQYGTASEKQPHNDFLRAYVETGVIGFGTFVAVIATLLGTAWAAIRAVPRGSPGHAVAVGAFGCAVAFSLSAAFANVMSNVVSLWYLFAFAAAAGWVLRSASGERRHRGR
ncbi:O-antigen ligase family protein [Knoellia sp. CPCC 206453]|uniref:O-antigen ligase family protein n=1 Tax=Knoellia pratensis TaxID=3404796 RepID=UPI0036153C86